MHRARRLGSPHLGAHAVRAMPEMRGDQLAASIRTIAPRPVMMGIAKRGVDVIRNVLLADDQEAVLELVVY